MAHDLIPGPSAPPSTVRFAESISDLARYTRMPVYRICRQVTRYLRAHGAPASLSVFQLAMAVALRERVMTVDWRQADGRYWLPLTQEVVDLFPEMSGVPPRNRVGT